MKNHLSIYLSIYPISRISGNQFLSGCWAGGFAGSGALGAQERKRA